MNKRVAILLAVMCSIALHSASAARAQINSPATASATPISTTVSPINLTLSPVTLFLETEPGLPTQAAIKVRNNSTETETLTISFGTFRADQTGQKPQLITPNPTDTFMDWISVETPTIEVSPGEWETITVDFKPPAEAALSYYYTIVINRSSDVQAPGETVIKGAPAVLLLATVKSPNALRSLELNAFTAQWPVLDFLPQTFSVNIKNAGNVHVVPAGNIFIDGQGKKDLAVLTLNPSYSAILPDSSRTLEVTWNEGFPQKISDPTTPPSGLKIGSTYWDFAHADRFRLGKYTAHLLMVYDNGERDVPIESFVSFWVIPWQLLLVGCVLIALVIIGGLSIIKSLWHIVRKTST